MTEKPLTYSDYINDAALIEALRIPQPPPAGQTDETWPLWHPPGESGPGVEWSPGEPWPRGGVWRHDEVLFIRTHQAFEVWFALVLHEFDAVLRDVSDVCDANGTALTQVKLERRRQDGPPHAPAEFPALARTADDTDAPQLAERIRRITAPGRHHETTAIRIAWFRPDQLALAAARLHRATLAIRWTIPFFEVLSTLTPAEFLQFRGRLVPASGFGSVQFREIELTLGLREINAVKFRPPAGSDQPEPGGPSLPPGMLRPTEQTPPGLAANCFYRTLPPAAWPRLARRFAKPGLRDMVYALLNAGDLLWADGAAARRAMDELAALNVRDTFRDWRQSGGG
ncbi:MAG: tryptophan 2,3-dioxygenase family protein, partial [Phycisphaerae bacterium]